MHLEINNQKKIDYKEVVNFPFLELNEAIDIFTGITHFPEIWKPTLEEATYLLRDTINCDQSNYTFSQKPHSKLRKMLKENVESLLEAGMETEASNIKSLRPIWPTSPAPPQEEQVLYLCRTEFLLHWALRKGLSLPKGLQKLLGINQAANTHTNITLPKVRHICIQALAQLLWSLKENKALSQGDLIKLIEEVIFLNSYRGKQLRQYHLGKGPLDYLISIVHGKKKTRYFKTDKGNSLIKLLIPIDPRPKEYKEGRPNKSKITSDLLNNPEESFPFRSIPGVFSKNKPYQSMNFQKLALVLQTFGYYLYKMRIVAHIGDALGHPTIAYYLQDNDALKAYAMFCLKDVCPEKEYIDIIKSLSSSSFRWQFTS